MLQLWHRRAVWYSPHSQHGCGQLMLCRTMCSQPSANKLHSAAPVKAAAALLAATACMHINQAGASKCSPQQAQGSSMQSTL